MNELWTAFLESIFKVDTLVIIMIFIVFSTMSYVLTTEVEAVLSTFEIKLNNEGKKKWRRLFTGIAIFAFILQFVCGLFFQMVHSR